MREAAVLFLLRGAAGVRNADVGGDNDVRRARVFGWVVVVDCKGWAVEDLPKGNPGGRGVIFEDFDAGVGIGGVLQPEERDVVFRGSDAIAVGRLRVRDEACI